MNRFQQACAIALSLYVLYLLKSAAGIDISTQHHAIDLIKIPANSLIHRFDDAVRFFTQA
ncbi:hypothetical protein JOY44_06595 [Phormidium sp. CLA17]|uniref:hypothetical protein n=1 Tax=Leptolyngbya sp. Cla-17 TaxID=2803751 RepID=UPI0014924E69|nr:hypothetical protein [Leptolyngbya sp. Cla-17]MBM0741289.1 hypothetical protein [Leptolyngbya sp. Cla-17]